ncbi:MAG TPA: hypothetical protein VLA92_01115 [Candidatus Saccharimonadales bacterium]|nr:hypothetical protein [Candidatus Saccharimonadales bacterium]
MPDRKSQPSRLAARTRPCPEPLAPEAARIDYKSLIAAYELPEATNIELINAITGILVAKSVSHRRGTLLFGGSRPVEEQLGIQTPYDWPALHKAGATPPLLHRKVAGTRKSLEISVAAEMPTYADPKLRVPLISEIDSANELTDSYFWGNPRKAAREESREKIIAATDKFHVRLGDVALTDIPNTLAQDTALTMPYELECHGAAELSDADQAITTAADLGAVRQRQAQYIIDELASYRVR